MIAMLYIFFLLLPIMWCFIFVIITNFMTVTQYFMYALTVFRNIPKKFPGDFVKIIISRKTVELLDSAVALIVIIC